MLLYLDLFVCPYFSDAAKKKAGEILGHDATDLEAVKASNPYWFTNWEGFDLSIELNKKRVREVY